MARLAPARAEASQPAAQPQAPDRADQATRDRAAARAAEWLLHNAPAASAALGPTPVQAARGRAVAGACAGAILFAPGLAAWTAGAATAAVFLALAVFRLAAVATPPRRPRRRRRPRGPTPTYTVIAPLYREARVLPALVERLARLDHPRDKLDIKIVLETDDLETRRAAAALELEPPFEVLVVPPGAPRTKPRALNYALAFARGAVIAVYDAEDRPHPAQLKAALAAFAAGPQNLAVVQAPLGWWNAHESWITRQFAIEYAAQFHVVLPALARWGWPLPLGGTSNHFRRDALEAVGGWDPHNVTEDADLGFRLARAGYRADVIAPPTSEEAPTGLRPWTLQRSRWIKGFLQTWRVHTRGPAAARGASARRASLLFTIGLSAAASFAHLPLAMLTIAGAAGVLLGAAPQVAPALALAAFGVGVAALTGWVGLRRAGLGRLWRQVFMMPAYWPLQTIAALRAARDLVLRPHHWEKTTHGVTRWRPGAR